MGVGWVDFPPHWFHLMQKSFLIKNLKTRCKYLCPFSIGRRLKFVDRGNWDLNIYRHFLEGVALGNNFLKIQISMFFIAVSFCVQGIVMTSMCTNMKELYEGIDGLWEKMWEKSREMEENNHQYVGWFFARFSIFLFSPPMDFWKSPIIRFYRYSASHKSNFIQIHPWRRELFAFPGMSLCSNVQLLKSSFGWCTTCFESP